MKNAIELSFNEHLLCAVIVGKVNWIVIVIAVAVVGILVTAIIVGIFVKR